MTLGGNVRHGRQFEGSMKSTISSVRRSKRSGRYEGLGDRSEWLGKWFEGSSRRSLG